MEPLQTFLDDPLRILRVVRFAQRYSFQIAPEIFDAAMNPDVRESFATKISVERITKEMDKMFTGRNAHISLNQLK